MDDSTDGKNQATKHGLKGRMQPRNKLLVIYLEP